MNLVVRIDQPCQGPDEFQRVCESLVAGLNGKKVIKLKNANVFSIEDKSWIRQPTDLNDPRLKDVVGRFLAHNLLFFS